MINYKLLQGSIQKNQQIQEHGHPLTFGGLATHSNNNKHLEINKHYTKRENEESSIVKIP